MFHGGIAIRLVRFAQAAIGAVRGGLGIVNVLSSMLFGGISRSAIAGIIIPPSHNMIIFAIAAGGSISISKLFLAGVVPGVLMCLCLCLAVAAYIVTVRRGYRAGKFPGWSALVVSLVGAIPGLLTAVIIVSGVLSGVFTVTESGVFGVIYAFLVTLPPYRSISWESFSLPQASRFARRPW